MHIYMQINRSLNNKRAAPLKYKYISSYVI